MSSLRNHIPRLGAVTKISKEYVSPWDAMKDEEYACPDCNNEVIFCKGEIVKPYFRHKNDGSSKCSRYDSPSESQIHKDVKVILQKHLEKRVPIVCNRTCIRCNEQETYNIDVDEYSKIVVEHPFDFNNRKKIADIACVNISDNTIDVIFEIMNTHKTEPTARPEPWFEIDAKEFLEHINSFIRNRKLKCIRKFICNNCIDKEDEIIHRKCEAMDKQSLQEIVRDPAFENYVRYNLGQRKFNPQSWEEERVDLPGGRVYYKEARAKHLRFNYNSRHNKVCDTENERLLSPFQRFMGEKKVIVISGKGHIAYKIISVRDTKEPKVPKSPSEPSWREWEHFRAGYAGTVGIIMQLLKDFDNERKKAEAAEYSLAREKKEKEDTELRIARAAKAKANAEGRISRELARESVLIPPTNNECAKEIIERRLNPPAVDIRPICINCSSKCDVVDDLNKRCVTFHCSLYNISKPYKKTKII